MNNKHSDLNNHLLCKLRIQFVIIAMLSLVIMQGIIIYISGSYIYNKMLKKSDMLISDIYSNATLYDNANDIDAIYFYVITDASGKTQVYNTNNRSIKPKEAVSYYRYASEMGHFTGFYKGYRYSLYNNDNSTIAIFLLRSSMIEEVKHTILSMIIISSSGLLMMLVFLILISKKMVMPIANSYQKQKEFVTSASHELKTPLAVIKADVDVLIMDCTDKNTEWLSDIKMQVDNMSAMTNKLITLARLDERARNIVKTSFNISELAQEMVISYNAMAINRHLNFTYSIKPDLLYKGDSAAIRQLFSILLDNAFKYVINNGNIHISLTTSHNKLSLKVRNNVESIANGQLDKMFDRFYRSDSAAANIKGFGLGLSIAKAIVTAHNGTIHAKAVSKQQAIDIIVNLPM